MKKARCYNCTHSSRQFKIGKLTHVHCTHPKYEIEKGETSPWETLMVFSYSCIDHEFKLKNK